MYRMLRMPDRAVGSPATILHTHDRRGGDRAICVEHNLC